MQRITTHLSFLDRTLAAIARAHISIGCYVAVFLGVVLFIASGYVELQGQDEILRTQGVAALEAYRHNIMLSDAGLLDIVKYALRWELPTFGGNLRVLSFVTIYGGCALVICLVVIARVVTGSRIMTSKISY